MRNVRNSIVSVFVAFYLCDQGTIPALFSNHYIVFVQNRRGCFGFERCRTKAEEMDFRYDLVEFGSTEQTAAVFPNSGTGIDSFSNSSLYYSVFFRFASNQILSVYWCDVSKYIYVRHVQYLRTTGNCTFHIKCCVVY